jgi:type II secretory pathway pseudopilin PulG
MATKSAATAQSDAAILREREQRDQAVFQLLQSWVDEGDEEEQRETLAYLKQALDEDRSSARQLFPTPSHGEHHSSRRRSSGASHSPKGGRRRKDL